jgi:FtsH-binding integral membrane protein
MIVTQTQIRTGHPVADQMKLDELKRQYQAQGLVVNAQPMPGGGFDVTVTRPPPQPAYVPPPAYPQEGHQPQGYQAQGYPAQGHQAQGYQAQGYPAQGHQPQGYQAQGYPPAGYAPQGYQPAHFGGGGMAYAGMGGAPSALTGEESLGAERGGYLRKVYGLLARSAFFAIGAGFLSTSPLLGTETFKLDAGKSIEVPFVVAAMLENPHLEYGAFALLFVGVFAASMVSKVKGLNYAALFGVAILMGVELAPMVFVAQVMAGMGATMTAAPVQASLSMVGAIFVGLTSYVFIAKKDFSYLGATLSMGFFVVLAGCIVAFFIDSEPLTLAIASVGALLSIGFLLYQTSYIFKHSDMDDPVDDALGLIVQLRNLFMFLLRIFMSRR